MFLRCRCCKRNHDHSPENTEDHSLLPLLTPSSPPLTLPSKEEMAQIRLKRLAVLPVSSTNSSPKELCLPPPPKQSLLYTKRKFRELVCKETSIRRPSKPWEGSFSYDIQSKETLFLHPKEKEEEHDETSPEIMEKESMDTIESTSTINLPTYDE